MPDLKNPWIKRVGILVAIIPFIWIFRRLDFHKMLADLADGGVVGGSTGLRRNACHHGHSGYPVVASPPRIYG